MKADAIFWEWLLACLCVAALLAGYYINDARARRRHSQECFDAMLRMLLQPTASNIAALDGLLLKRRLAEKKRNELLHHAEVEADCLSIMPTGEMRASQPFLERRYKQILATAASGSAVADLVKKRLSSF
jgi:hypothetical protein